MPQTSDRYTVLKINPFNCVENTQGKTVSIMISFNWQLLLGENQQIDDDIEIGSPITINKKKYTHHDYFACLCNLFAEHDFKKINIVVGGTLQQYNLVSARNQPITNEDALECAHKELYELENRLIERYQSTIKQTIQVEKQKTFTFMHWNDICTPEEYIKSKQKFQNIRSSNQQIQTEFFREMDSFKARSPYPYSDDTGIAYLDDAMTNIMKMLEQTDYLIYSNHMPIVRSLEQHLFSNVKKFYSVHLEKISFNKLCERYKIKNNDESILPINVGVLGDRHLLETKIIRHRAGEITEELSNLQKRSNSANSSPSLSLPSDSCIPVVPEEKASELITNLSQQLNTDLAALHSYLTLMQSNKESAWLLKELINEANLRLTTASYKVDQILRNIYHSTQNNSLYKPPIPGSASSLLLSSEHTGILSQD